MFLIGRARCSFSADIIHGARCYLAGIPQRPGFLLAVRDTLEPPRRGMRFWGSEQTGQVFSLWRSMQLCCCQVPVSSLGPPGRAASRRRQVVSKDGRSRLLNASRPKGNPSG